MQRLFGPQYSGPQGPGPQDQAMAWLVPMDTDATTAGGTQAAAIPAGRVLKALVRSRHVAERYAFVCPHILGHAKHPLSDDVGHHLISATGDSQTR